MANYFCQKPRQLLLEGTDKINKQFCEWCKLDYIPKPSPANITERTEIQTEPPFKARSGTNLTLFNYLTYIYTSRQFKNEQDTKAYWLNRKASDNFMKAVSRPMYDTVMKKVLEDISHTI